MSSLRILALTLLLGGCAALGPLPPSETDFARVRVGMTHDEIRRLLGTPNETMKFPRSATESWDYEYWDTWGYLSAYSVIFGMQGTVVGKMTVRIRDGGDLGSN
jgi:outer membrane protein assembly factor BamE (lipoprotein component of BamABCDE complex)